MIKSSKSGFTLAEVLTTLMVIGVVAAMTIPTLLNSTADQQAKVAAKKAASVLSQAVQLMKAKEIECNIEGDSGLAACMSQVLSGTLNGDTLTTQDGMEYTFFASARGGDFETACGGNFGTWKGGGNCGVVVDTNGSGKGYKGLQVTQKSFSNKGFSSSVPGRGTDQIAFSLSLAGARPIATSSGTAADNTYKYIYGKTPASSAITNPTICIRQGLAENTDYTITDSVASIEDGDYYYTQSTSCSNGFTKLPGAEVVVGK